MATVRDFQVNNGLEVNLNANVANAIIASDYLVNASGPTTSPSLSVDFRSATQLDSRFTFTRTSGATYQAANGTIVIASNNTPRFEFVNGTSQGMLIEEQRTNLYPVSETLTTMYDTATQTYATIPGGSPAGTDCLQVTSRVEAAFNSLYMFDWSSGISLGAAQQVTVSMFVKPISPLSSFADVGIRLWTGGGRAWTTNRYAIFNFSSGTGVFSYTSGVVDDYSITPYKNGWYRISITATTDQAGAPAFSFFFNGGYTIGTTWQVWGVQVERGLYPTSYIPTGGAAATRMGDVVYANTLSGGWFNQSKGTLYGEFTIKTPGFANTGYPQYLTLTGADPDNQLMGVYWPVVTTTKYASFINYNTVANTVYGMVDNVANTPTTVPMSANNTYKAAFSYTPNTFIGAVSGSYYSVGFTGVNPTMLRLSLCQPARYQYQPSCYFKKVAFYPNTMTAPQLQYLTS